MGDLDDQLRRLADRRAERTPSTDASTVLAGGRPRGRFPMLAAAAAAVVVLVGVSLWLLDPGDDDGADVTANPSTTTEPEPTTTDPDPTTTEPGTTEPKTTEPTDTTAPTTTEPAAPASPSPYDAVAATAEGIELRKADEPDQVDVLAVGPTALAFEVGGYLVHQGADSLLWRDGPVFLRPPSAEESLALHLGGRFDTLHDAKIIDGRPTALVSRRTGDTPETADERLLLVDLEMSNTTDLGRFGGWESGVADGRLGDGLIALHRTAEAVSWIQVIDYRGDEMWSTPEELEYPWAIALGPDGVWAVDAGWTDDLTAAELTVSAYDFLTGEVVRTSTVTLDPSDGVDLDGGYCRRPIVDGLMRCGQSSGVPIAIDPASGAVGVLRGFTAGVVTPVDAEATSSTPSG